MHTKIVWTTIILKRFLATNLALANQTYINNCRLRVETQPCKNTSFRSFTARIFDACDGFECIMRIHLVSNLQTSNGFSNVVTASVAFSDYQFKKTPRELHASSLVHRLSKIISQPAYVPRHILSEEGSTFFSEVINNLMQAPETRNFTVSVNFAALKSSSIVGTESGSYRLN